MVTGKITIPLAVAILFSASLTTSSAAPTDKPGGTILAIAEKAEDLSFFVKALKAAGNKTIEGWVYSHEVGEKLVSLGGGLMEILDGKGPFTVFAPTNAAFDALPNEVLQYLFDPANVKDLIHVLKGHVIACEGVFGAPATRTCFNNATLRGWNVWFKDDAPTPQVSWDAFNHEEPGISLGPPPAKTKANVTLANQFAVNGVMHVVDQIFLSADILGRLCRPYNFSEPLNRSKCYAHFCSVCSGNGQDERCYNPNTDSCCATAYDSASTCHRGTHSCAKGLHGSKCCDLSVSKPCSALHGVCIPKDSTCCGEVEHSHNYMQGQYSCQKGTTCCGNGWFTSYCCSDATQVCDHNPGGWGQCSNKSVVV